MCCVVGIWYETYTAIKRCVTMTQVCGTDGVTYNSICHLRGLSANAQVDYRGECIDNANGNLRDICSRVRCTYDATNCERRVLPRDACCPVCGKSVSTHSFNNRIPASKCIHQATFCSYFYCSTGGITTLAIDRNALDEYSRATDSDANLDEFMARMIGDDVIPEDVRRRCTIEVTHVRNSTEVRLSLNSLSLSLSLSYTHTHTHTHMYVRIH